MHANFPPSAICRFAVMHLVRESYWENKVSTIVNALTHDF